MILLCLAGCGGEEERHNIGERLSGPAANSALPMRVDETPTPTPTPTSTITPEPETTGQPDVTKQTQEEDIELEESRDTTIPEPDATQSESPSDSEKEQEAQSDESEVEPAPSPTPASVPTTTPSPSPGPTPEKDSSSVNKIAETAQTAQETSNAETDKDTASQKLVETPKKEATQAPAAKKEVQQQTALPSSQNITLNQAEICSKISNRQPAGIAATFSLAKVKKIYTWMKVSGANPQATVKHIYYRNGDLVATVKLKLKYASMRTWSQKTFKAGESIGEWKVVITTGDEENALAVKTFTVTP